MLNSFNFLFKNNNALKFSELKIDLNLLMVNPVTEKNSFK